MSVRYFKTPTGVAQYGGLTEDGLQVLLDAEHEEITAEEYRAEETRQAEAAAALMKRGGPGDSDEQPESAHSGGAEE